MKRIDMDKYKTLSEAQKEKMKVRGQKSICLRGRGRWKAADLVT